MNRLIDRIVLLLVSIWCMACLNQQGMVYLVLGGLIFAALCYCFPTGLVHMTLNLVLWIGILFSDIYAPLILLLVYETASSLLEHNKKPLMLMGISCTVYVLTCLAGRNRPFLTAIYENRIYLVVYGVSILLAIYFAYMSYQHGTMKTALIRSRDDNEEFRRIQAQKNELLRKNKDNEISMATLNERNRIAREIHDTVGHLLSRSILQMGALQAVYREEPLATGLSQVSETLNESMNNIRNSVHNLHNEAFDLKKELEACIQKQVNRTCILDYDLPIHMEKELKYTFLAIVQEALSNIEKHSDASEVSLVFREHPAFYQMIIRDNGHPAPVKDTGIGLHNMESRVKEYGGTIHFSTENGFRIFIMIPKKEEQLESNRN